MECGALKLGLDNLPLVSKAEAAAREKALPSDDSLGVA
jgi:hypothetical protein